MSPLPAPDPVAEAGGATAQSLGLGKYVASGYGGNPTWIDPAAADWAAVAAGQYKWVQFDYTASDPVVTFGLGAVAVMSVTPIGSTFGGADTSFGNLTFATRDHWDGAGGDSGASVTLAAGGASDAFIQLQASPDAGSVYVKGNAGQTDALIDAQASDGADVIEVTGDKKIGFYNQAPVAQQTGVAVDAAGIHAALVALGLITA